MSRRFFESVVVEEWETVCPIECDGAEITEVYVAHYCIRAL